MLGRHVTAPIGFVLFVSSLLPQVAMAQTVVGMASTPVSRTCLNDPNAPAGDVTVYTGGSPNGMGASTISINYVYPIANSANVPPGLPVEVTGGGSFAGKVTGVIVSGSSVTASLAALTPGAESGTLTFSKVRLNLSNSFATSVTAFLSAPGYFVTVGQDTGSVITAANISCVAQPPATITSISKTSGLQGAQVNATITGTDLIDANGSPPGGTYVIFSGRGVIAIQSGSLTDNSFPVTITIDPDAPPGVRTFAVAKLGSVSNSLVFTVVARPGRRAQVTSSN